MSPVRTLANVTMLLLGVVACNFAQGGIIIIPPGGDVVTWTDGALNGNWEDSGNWNVHVPENGDAVIINDSAYNVVLHENSADLRSLYVSNGIALYNFYNRLRVRNDDDDATTTITGNGSGIVVSDFGGSLQGYNTDYLVINNGAYLRMDGGKAHADREVDVNGTSEIRGYGVLEVGGGGAFALSFASNTELRPQNGNLRINMTGGGGISLGHAYIDVTDDDSDLIFDGELTGAIDDTLRIGAGNRVDFEGDWEVDGLLNFTTGGGEIVGGRGEMDGQLQVNAFVSAEINTRLDFNAASETTLNAYSTMEINGRVSSAAGHVTDLQSASLLRINMPATFGKGILLPQFLIWNGHINATGANLEVNLPGGQVGAFILNGSMDVSGNGVFGPTDIGGTAPFWQSGTMLVMGAGGRIDGAGMQFRNSSLTTINFGSQLDVQSFVRVNEGAAIHGSGDIVIAKSGRLWGEDDAVVNVDVVNHGEVRVGVLSNTPSHVEFADRFVQSETGTLDIDLAGIFTSQYDRLIVGNGATLDGTLDVSLVGGYEPSLGDDFLVLTTGDGLTGTFASAILPDLNEGLAWDLDYSPFALTLSVVDAPLSADVDLDGDVDGLDFLMIQRTDPSLIPLWESQYGSSSVGAAAAAFSAVPEPETLTLAVLLGTVGLVSGARRRNS